MRIPVAIARKTETHDERPRDNTEIRGTKATILKDEDSISERGP